METKDNIQKGWRTREQKQEIIQQWQQSGKTRKEFCMEQGISYNSLVSWCKELRDKKSSNGFTEVKLNQTTSLFAQVLLPGGIKIDFYQSIPAELIRSFIKT